MTPSPRPEPTPVVFLHGFFGTADDWDDVAWELADDRPVVAVDLPGHEPADEPLDEDEAALPTDLASAARAVVRHLDHLELTRVDIVGYSLGGRIAAALAGAAPQRVRKLVLIGARLEPDTDPTREARDRAWAQRLRDEGVAAFLEAWWQQPLFDTLRRHPDLPTWRARRLRGRADRLADVLEALTPAHQPDLVPALAAADLPVLLVAGEHDAGYRHANTAVAARLPRATVHVVPGAGHAPHLEAPDALADAVRAFLG
ncbi:MAG: alpha/beta fold hydrolase [Planctomycetota bacterium]